MTIGQLVERLRYMDPTRELWVRIPDGCEPSTDFPLLDCVTDEESPAAFIVGEIPPDVETIQAIANRASL